MTKDELYQKVRWTPRVHRVVLKSNSQMGLQDQCEQDARTSYDQPSGSKCSWETGSNTVDYRIPGIEQQDTHREDKVKRLIVREPPEKKNLLSRLQADTKEINKFSEKSQELITDMNNTEIFELCETSSKQQCPDCNNAGKQALSVVLAEDA